MTSNNASIHVSQNSKMEKNNILAAYHMLRFSKQDKDFNIADIECRSLAVKNMTAKLFDSEDTAAVLLRKDLENYHTLMADTNNYWRQIKSQLQDIENNALKWKSELEDEDATLNLIKPLACQKINTLSCKGRSYNDRDIEKIVNNSTRSKDTRERKISSQLQASSSHNSNKELLLKPNNSEQNISTYFTNIHGNDSSSKHISYIKQNASKIQSSRHSYQNLDKFVQKKTCIKQ